jgi:hypothetical protein
MSGAGGPRFAPDASEDRASEVAFAALAQRLLDGELDERGAERLSAMVSEDPLRARELAQLTLLHDALERESTLGDAARLELRNHRRTSWRRAALLAASCVVLAAVVAAIVLPVRRASASDALVGIVSMLRSGDRTYLVRTIPETRRARSRAGEVGDSRSALRRASIDGALLALRPPASSVLVRLDPDGREVVVGTDGRTAWMVPAEGPARRSGDPTRFQGVLPGSRLGVPFVDPRALLAGSGPNSLAASYELLLEESVETESGTRSRIVAIRRADARGGPKRIEVEFDRATSLVELIRLENLPQAHGGPRSVEFLLVDDAPLPDDFFSLPAHLPPGRSVIEEP